RTLRYRNLLMRQTVQLKNKIAQMLMEAGVSYAKEKLHYRGYFHQLLATNQDIDESLRPLLQLTRENIVRLRRTEAALLRSLKRDPLLAERVKRLMTIPAVGPITALSIAGCRRTAWSHRATGRQSRENVCHTRHVGRSGTSRPGTRRSQAR